MCDISRLIVRRSEYDAVGRSLNALARDERRGIYVRLAAGAYMRSSDWGRLRPDRQHAARVLAAVPRLAPDVVVSHESALAVRGFPLLGAWPERVQVIAPRRTRAKVTTAVHHHAVPLARGEISSVDGLRTVTAARAAVDVVRTRDLRGAAVVLDHGLRTGHFDHAALDLTLAPRRHVQGGRQAARGIAFADGLAGSPGESLSRAVMHEAGLAAPVLQHRFTDRGRFCGIVDFWWPKFGVIGEFDGESKYTDGAMRVGRSAEQVVLDEKYREDALRSHPEVRTLVRWNWHEALRGGPMLRKLARAGVR